MLNMTNRGLILALLAAAVLVSRPAAAMQPPAGWTRTQSGAAETFQPSNLAADESFAIMVHPATTTRGQRLNTWLDAWATDKLPGSASGKLVSELGSNGQSATAQLMAKDARGASVFVMFVAVSLDGDRVRAMRIVATPKPELFARQKPAIGEFVKLLATDEASGYRQEQRSVGNGAPASAGNAAGNAGDAKGARTYVETQARDARTAKANAGVPRGSRQGGPFRYGTYDFEFPLPAINQVRRYRISFYENGEYRKIEGKSEDTDDFTYDAATGAVNISVLLNLYNSSYDDADFCRYYVAPDGRPYIYAEDEYGVGTHQITGRYLGPNDRPSPTVEKAAKSAAKAEADRFKWITAPGRGVQMAQISGVLHRMEQLYLIGGLELRERTYLLLNDGSAYENLRCPPDQLDVLTSRKREPLSWGRWRLSGGRYELQFPKQDGSMGAWNAPSMTTITRPGAKGQRLQGRYQHGSSFQIPGGAGSVSYHGIRFSADGRFETDNFSITGGTSGFGDAQIAAGVVANDEGAVSSVSGPNFGGGSSRKSNRPKSERTGRYEIDGYTLVLSFDNGTVERLPFFLQSGNRQGVWFRGAVHTLEK